MHWVYVPRTVSHSGYKYMMPLLQQNIEGNGINIRTNLTNLKDVARSLRVPPYYILKFMGIELGTNTNIKDGLFTIDGEINAEDVLSILDKFIDRFLLCPKCKFPEMELRMTFKKSLTGKCNACGNTVDHDCLKLRKLVAHSYFSPLSAEDLSIFARIVADLKLILPMNDAYEFDDCHVELINNYINHLRLDKILYDRIGYLLFSYLFDEKLLKQIDSRAILFENVLECHGMVDFIGHEVLLNVQHFCYHMGAAPEWSKRVPTILKKFYDQDMLTDVN